MTLEIKYWGLAHAGISPLLHFQKGESSLCSTLNQHIYRLKVLNQQISSRLWHQKTTSHFEDVSIRTRWITSSNPPWQGLCRGDSALLTGLKTGKIPCRKLSSQRESFTTWRTDSVTSCGWLARAYIYWRECWGDMNAWCSTGERRAASGGVILNVRVQIELIQ